jgi:phosphoglycolate phosphatase
MNLWIFDLDGTLVDTSGDIVHAVNRLLAAYEREPLSREEVMRHVGRGTPFLVSKVLDLEPGSRETAEAASRFVGIYTENPVERSRPYPGTRETLEVLASSSVLGVLSNKSAPLVHATLRALDLGRHLTFAWGGGEFGGLKPAPDGVLKAMEQTSTPPERTTMVGDLPLDIAAGRSAGARTLFASWGFGRLGPGDPEPDGQIGSITDLLAP